MPQMPRLIALSYAIVALITGVTLSLCMPPMMYVDEWSHFGRAYQISRGQLIGQRFNFETQLGHPTPEGREPNPVAGGPIPIGIPAVMWKMQTILGHPEIKVTRDMMTEASAAHWTDGIILISFSNTVRYPPVFYLPSALGIAIGKTLNLTVSATLIVSRMLSTIVAVGIGTVAILLASTAAPWFFTVLTMPTALGLASTSGQEGLLNATAALACACTLRLMARPQQADFYVAVAALLLAVSARPPLIPLALILLAIPSIPWRHRLGGLITVIVGTAGWIMLAAQVYVHGRSGSDPTIDPANFGTKPQLLHVLAHPIAFFETIFRTLQHFGFRFYYEFLGVLGWDVVMPLWYDKVAIGMLALGVLASSPMKQAWPPLTVPLTAAIGVIGCAVAILTVQYLDWTSVGNDIIDGVFGRYFVAPTFFLIMLFPMPTRALRIRAYLAMAVIIFAVTVTVPVVFSTVIDRYYLR
jgi:uncharacterized membrane protein